MAMLRDIPALFPGPLPTSNQKLFELNVKLGTLGNSHARA